MIEWQIYYLSVIDSDMEKDIFAVTILDLDNIVLLIRQANQHSWIYCFLFKIWLLGWYFSFSLLVVYVLKRKYVNLYVVEILGRDSWKMQIDGIWGWIIVMECWGLFWNQVILTD
jgi:hypothetical protein